MSEITDTGIQQVITEAVKRRQEKIVFSQQAFSASFKDALASSEAMAGLLDHLPTLAENKESFGSEELIKSIEALSQKMYAAHQLLQVKLFEASLRARTLKHLLDAPSADLANR